MESERRKYIRVDIRDIIKCELFTISEDSNAKKEFFSKNISAGGILFSSNEKYKVEDLLKLEINAVGWEKYLSEFYKPEKLTVSNPLVALATVVRVEAMDDGTYDIGVSLNAVDESHQKALDKFLKAKNKN